MPIFEHDDIQFNYELTGSGQAVVLCHGLTGDLEQPKELIGDLPGFQRLLWDARGHGKTRPAGPSDGFTFDVFARDLIALLDHLHIRDAIVGGISMGAAVSVRVAVRDPERFRGLVLIRPAWVDQPLPEGLQFYPMVGDYIGRFGVEKGSELFKISAEYQAFSAQFPDTAAGLESQFFQDSAVERRGRLVGIPNDAPIRDWNEVKPLLMPALVIGNEPDPIHPLSYAVMWAKQLPRGRLVQVPPKLLDFENHTRSVRRHLAAFLDSPAAAYELTPSNKG